MRSTLLLISAILIVAAPGWTAPRAAPSARRAPAPAKAAAAPLRALTLAPATVLLDGPATSQHLLATGTATDGLLEDRTRSAHFRTGNPKIAQVSGGVLRAVADGTTWVEVQAGGKTARVPVRVQGTRVERPVSFVRDVMPALSRAGCNSAACHAKQGGKNGFQLSVLAFDLEADYHAIARQAHSRRVNRLDPGASLLLTKATAAVAHGGGERFKVNSPEYRLVARWIAEGASWDGAVTPALTGVEVEPRERVLRPGGEQQLLVTAVYADGSRRDVTGLSQFHSDETSIADVDESGRLKATTLMGEAAIMTRFMGQVAVARVTLPQKGSLPANAYAAYPRQNFIDELIYRKLAKLNVLPSGACDDATFLRRAYVDLIGTLPTPEETRAFLAECEAETDSQRQEAAAGGRGEAPRALRTRGELPGAKPASLEGGAGKAAASSASNLSPKTAPVSVSQNSPRYRGAGGASLAPAAASCPPALKARAQLLEQLLNRNEYADYWGMRWSNILLVNPDLLLPRGAYAFDRWLRDSFRRNMPFDQFAREIVTGSGESYREGPPNFYRALPVPGDAARAVSQLFLGVRLDCAQCHHHPFERWGQDDFYSLAAFFARVKQKSSYPEGYHSIIYAGTDGEVKHPKTDQVMAPRPLAAKPLEIPDGEDRREALAQWMTSRDNPFFARTIVNRMWGLLMGRGIVEPVDDFRGTNPASNPELLDALANDFVQHGYDLKHLIRTITASAAYQRSSDSIPANVKDHRNFARYFKKRLPAEVLLDAVGQVTGVPDTFRGHPEGTRAIQMWDSRLQVEFLETFGKPIRMSVCECERATDGSVPQALHLMNSGEMQTRLSKEKGVVATLAASQKSEDEIITELYLRAFNRLPTGGELTVARTAFKRDKATRRQATEDILWALLNSAEFILNH